MKTTFFLFSLLLCTIGSSAIAQETSTPSALDLLRQVRIHQTSADLKLPGTIRTGPDTIPFVLTAKKGIITYQFQNPTEAIVLKLGNQDAKLEHIADGKTVSVAPAQRGEKIRGTDITLQDLSFDFLYWKTAEVLGEELVATRRTLKIQLRSPSGDYPYAAVIVFIDQDGGALMQMEAYDWEGKIIRRFKVTSGQKINGQWMLKQMRVEKMNPLTRKVESRTYIEMNP